MATTLNYDSRRGVGGFLTCEFDGRGLSAKGCGLFTSSESYAMHLLAQHKADLSRVGQVKALMVLNPDLSLKEATVAADAARDLPALIEARDEYIKQSKRADFAQAYGRPLPVAFIHVTDAEGNVVGTVELDAQRFRRLTTNKPADRVANAQYGSNLYAEIIGALSEVKV